mgnify:CR=1 FL=1
MVIVLNSIIIITLSVNTIIIINFIIILLNFLSTLQEDFSGILVYY